MRYNKFSDYLKSKYGEKVYKLPVNIPVSCPNRDGKISDRGCIFCGEEGAGFELLPNSKSVDKQLYRNAAYIGKRYNAKKFIAYFQNFSNTYVEPEKFRKYLYDVCGTDLDIVEIYISTRPDCVTDEHIIIMNDVKKIYGKNVLVELGLQSVNEETLRFLNRGHTVKDFDNAVKRLKSMGIEVCAHFITDIPTDSDEDIVQGAKHISSLNVDQVKCHSLYVLKDTELGRMYEAGEFVPLTTDDFKRRTILFLENLSQDIIVQRIIGRAPKERTLYCNGGRSWWKIQEEIEEE